MKKSAFICFAFIFILIILSMQQCMAENAYPLKGQIQGYVGLPVFTDSEFEKAKVKINVLTETWCKYCKNLEKEIPRLIYKKYSKEQVALRIWDDTVPEVKAYFKKQKDIWDLSPGTRDSYPLIAINDSVFFAGYDDSIRNSILQDIDALVNGKPLPFGGNIKSYSKETMTPDVKNTWKLKDSLKSINHIGLILAISTFFTAGIIDGINPCALSMLLFFVMVMINTDRKKTNVLLFGIYFAAGTFITYLLSGIGLINVIKQLYIVKYFPPVLYGIAIVLSFVIALLNFRDAYYAKKQNLKKIILQLTQKNKKYIHNIIGKFSGSKYKYLASFVLGLCVTLSELLCTGQVYLSVIIALNSLEGFMQKLYLLIFNIGFIIPILIVTYIINKTKEVMTPSGVLLEKLWLIKIFTGILMVLLCFYIIFQLLLFTR